MVRVAGIGEARHMPAVGALVLAVLDGGRRCAAATPPTPAIETVSLRAVRARYAGAGCAGSAVRQGFTAICRAPRARAVRMPRFHAVL
jgi:hypothetical protein